MLLGARSPQCLVAVWTPALPAAALGPLLARGRGATWLVALLALSLLSWATRPWPVACSDSRQKVSCHSWVSLSRESGRGVASRPSAPGAPAVSGLLFSQLQLSRVMPMEPPLRWLGPARGCGPCPRRPPIRLAPARRM